ncbi:zeta toxin [Olivibacter jilunii]|uniref:zeta toxin n=1 Tax=Olivibacter jilunii TaxID=985016 RepID=UPI003F1762ED
MPNLYIIAGCNGAGKTTASFTVLPEILDCKEFVNADMIAAGISPFNPESVALEAGRIMLSRIRELIDEKAVRRVAMRVAKGGHHIPDETVHRRHYKGIKNLIHLYIPNCDKWLVLDNMDMQPEIIAQCDEFGKVVFNDELWDIILLTSNGN